jgi:hypothetical protein
MLTTFHDLYADADPVFKAFYSPTINIQNSS